jgi:hypothetical protein
MKAATREIRATPAHEDRLREVMLVRIVGAQRGLTANELADALGPLHSNRPPPAQWRAIVEREADDLVVAGLAIESGGRIKASEAGYAHATSFLGMRGALPRDWAELRDVRLVARALSLHREPAKRLKDLARPDGLHAAIVQSAYKLKIKGAATPSRLREALAGVALERAFGNQVKSSLAGKRGLPAKAGRLLAAQLCRKPQDFGTDARLIAALAAEHTGASRADPDALRLAVLRKFVGGERARVASKPSRPPTSRQRLRALPTPTPPEVAGRPDLFGFAEEVQRHAALHAQGWAGDRKAYIGRVWRNLREQRPEWGLSEIEFKCMLTEAHRAGRLALANADLKDNESMQDLKDSAVVYKNAVFHFIRVDA